MDRLGTVAIVGVGLIGGSIGRALRVRGLAERVVGIGRDESRLAEAVDCGAIDAGFTDPRAGFEAAEVVVVCTPVTRIADDVRAAAEAAPGTVLITDAGSTKRGIVAVVERDPRAAAVFVGSHPIAGSERKGVKHAEPGLFQGRACILTPTERTPVDRLERTRAFWQALGCRLLETTPAEHDRVLALTSHLPHVVAAALAASVPVEALAMAAGAYRDGTRVAGSDASLWTGIFLENRMPLLEAIDTFQDQVAVLRQSLVDGDSDAIAAWWDAARARRSQYNEPADPAAPRT